MHFTRHLRPLVKSGAVTCSIRIWRSPRVRTGGRHAVEGGHIVVESVREITLDQVDDRLARRSGFADVADLLATARHGRGENVYLIEFRYEGGEA